MRKIYSYLRANHRLVLGWIAGFLLLMQVMNLHSYVVRAVDSQAIVATGDDDASWNIAKTVKTRWWKDNGWVLYGPAYFRLNHTIQYFWGKTAEVDPAADPAENWEKTAHHAILTVSLLSIFALTLLLGTFFLQEWWQRFLFSSALSSAFLSIPAWTEFVLRAHPDHLFSLVIVGAFLLTIKMFQRPAESFWYKASAAVWGISVSVKMTLVVAAPGFFFLFVPPLKREAFLRGLKYLGWMFLAYFLIGFPQTIVLDRPFRSAKTLAALSAPPNMSSVLHWLELYRDQILPVLLILALSWACLSFSPQKLSRSGWWRLGVFVALPFLFLLRKNMLVPSDHYVAPFVCLLTAYGMLAVAQLPRLQPDRYPYTRAALFLTAWLAIFGSTPNEMQVQLDKFTKCRAEGREALAKIRELYDQGERIWVDPYVPYITSAPKDRMEVSWEKGWPSFESGGWTVLALKDREIARYLPEEPDTYTRSATPNWREIRKFYLPFGNGAKEVTVPDGRVFKLIYANSCGDQIWKP